MRDSPFALSACISLCVLCVNLPLRSLREFLFAFFAIAPFR